MEKNTRIDWFSSENLPEEVNLHLVWIYTKKEIVQPVRYHKGRGFQYLGKWDYIDPDYITHWGYFDTPKPPTK